MKLSPRARAALYNGQPYGLVPSDLSDEVPLEVGAPVVLTARLAPELAGQSGTVVEVLGAEGDPYVVAPEYLVRCGEREFWLLPEHVEPVTP